MSRSIIMKTINEVSDLLDKEEGIAPKPEVYGGARPRIPMPMGRGLQAFPVPFGGCSDMYGGMLRKPYAKQNSGRIAGIPLGRIPLLRDALKHIARQAEAQLKASGQTKGDYKLAILNQWLASGEISQEEYNNLAKKILDGQAMYEANSAKLKRGLLAYQALSPDEKFRHRVAKLSGRLATDTTLANPFIYGVPKKPKKPKKVTGKGMVPVGYGMVPYGYGARLHG